MIYEKEVCYTLNINVLFGFAISIHISWPHINICFAIIFSSALYMHQNLRLMLDGCVCMCMCVCVRVCVLEREREIRKKERRKRKGRQKDAYSCFSAGFGKQHNEVPTLLSVEWAHCTLHLYFIFSSSSFVFCLFSLFYSVNFLSHSIFNNIKY